MSYPPKRIIQPSSAPSAGGFLVSPSGEVLNIGKSSTTLEREKASQSRLLRFALQATARELLPRESVARCLRTIIPVRRFETQKGDVWSAPGRGVDVYFAPLKRSAHYGGLITCKSVWMCPVCAAKISERRKQELEEALGIWTRQDADNHRLLLCTFTMQHSRDDDLSFIYKVMSAARAEIVSGGAATRFADRFNVKGQIRTLELTHGVNGWHPHYHVLMFVNKRVDITEFEDRLKKRWSNIIEKIAPDKYASYKHGVDVRWAEEDIAQYIAKWGKSPEWTISNEMTKSVSKKGRMKGRTPTQLLFDAMNGDVRSCILWREYAYNMKGERQLYWSNGLRKILWPEDEDKQKEKTDEEIEQEQDEIAIILCTLTPNEWRVVLYNDARAELLNAASSGDVQKVYEELLKLGIDRFNA